MENKLCPLPWIGIHSGSLGTTRPCCIAKDIITKPNGSPYQLQGSTISEIFNSEYMQDLRQSFRNGEQPETCKPCWDDEAAGGFSKRLHKLKQFSEDLETINWDSNIAEVPWYLDLQLGNICNLKCRICGSAASSKWAAEDLHLKANLPAQPGTDRFGRKLGDFLKDGAWPRDNDQFWEDLHTILPHVRQFDFTGGEPFLIQEHFDLLKVAVDKGYAKNIAIHYNTNGTVYPESAVELWKQFKTVEVAFSIDNTGARFEYERYGANWDEVNANIDKFRAVRTGHSNIKLQLCLTVSALNVLYIDTTLEWANSKGFDSKYINLLFKPAQLSIGAMPKLIKDAVESRLKQKTFRNRADRFEVSNLIKVMMNGKSADTVEALRLKIGASDAYRKQKLVDTHPELAELLNQSEDKLCLAPWVHTFVSPQGERRMCCASREPSVNFEQYIDSGTGVKDTLHLTKLEEHWNSEHMKDVRRRMLARETLPECRVCNEKELNTSVYRSYWNGWFGYKKDELLNATSDDGTFNQLPVSYDYRFSNICNFKCMHCGPMLSSQNEVEHLNLNMPLLNIGYGAGSTKMPRYLQPGIKEQVKKHQSVIEEEFLEAVEQNRIEDIYWCGGEPLVMPIHWKTMQQMIDNGHSQKVYVRYNTNLSQIQSRGTKLFDLLPHYRGWQVCASLDGTGTIGEYIRSGLNYNEFLVHYKEGMAAQVRGDEMRIDFTLTLPGLFEIGNIVDLSIETNTLLLSKMIFSYSPRNIFTPIALPRDLLHSIVNEQLEKIKPKVGLNQRSMVEMLEQLLLRKTYYEENHPNLQQDMEYGKWHIQARDKIRNKTTIEDILALDPRILDWWNSIEAKKHY
jgi:MoaA/NifB/PqqE/SkfB family radical SAM enzyme